MFNVSGDFVKDMSKIQAFFKNKRWKISKQIQSQNFLKFLKNISFNIFSLVYL